LKLLYNFFIKDKWFWEHINKDATKAANIHQAMRVFLMYVWEMAIAVFAKIVT
jgi:hypothetical protein